MEAKKLVGWNVRKHRVRQKMTLEDVAVAARTNASYVAEVERGEANIGLSLLDKLARALGLKPADLFIEPQPGEKPPAPLKAGRRPQKQPPAGPSFRVKSAQTDPKRVARVNRYIRQLAGNHASLYEDLLQWRESEAGRGFEEVIDGMLRQLGEPRRRSTAKPPKPQEQTSKRVRERRTHRKPKGLTRGS